jgi:hypothetical protein
VKENLEPIMQRGKGSVVKAAKRYKRIIMLTVEQMRKGPFVRGKKCTTTDYFLALNAWSTL